MATLSNLQFNGNNLKGTQGTQGIIGQTGIQGPQNTSGNGPFEVSTITSPYTLTSTDTGKLLKINAGVSTVGLNTVTIPPSTFNLGDVFLFFNESSPTQTINAGVGVSLYSSVGVASTGNKTIPRNGLCTVLCLTANEFSFSGNFNEIQPIVVSYDTLTFTASGNLTVTNNNTTNVNIFKTSGSFNWDNQAYISTPYIAPCTIEFNKEAASGDNGASYAMMSWNEDPTADASYSSLDYASYPYRFDTYSVYHNSSQVHFSGSWSTANKFYIVYGTDGTIKHYNGSTLLYSVSYGAGKTVYVDSSFYSVNATFGGFSNIKVIKSAWNGTSYVQ